MDDLDAAALSPLMEGKEDAIQDVAEYFTSLGIKNAVLLSPGCTPGT